MSLLSCKLFVLNIKKHQLSLKRGSQILTLLIMITSPGLKILLSITQYSKHRLNVNDQEHVSSKYYLHKWKMSLFYLLWDNPKHNNKETSF